ncbi:MAG: hypothetical protein Q9193_001696 [Seirophora villosa]
MAPGRMVPSFGLRPNRPTAAKTGFGGKTGPGARTGLGGQGLGKEPLRRHRRMARRGGVKRISSTIYDDARAAMTDRLKAVRKTNFFSVPTTSNGPMKDSAFSRKLTQRADPAGLRHLPRALEAKE